MVERKGRCKVLVETSEEKRPFRGPGVYGSILLRLIFRKWGGRYGLY
jgi:hypothetical protein